MRVIPRLFCALLMVALAGGPAVAALGAVSSTMSVSATSSADETPHSPLSVLLYGLAAFGAIRIKDAGSLARKFSQRASAAAGDYKAGVEAAGQDWQSRTAAAGDNYRDGVTAAIADGRFTKGVNDAGAGKYTQRASTLGAQRFPTGVAAAEGDWAKGAGPYLDELRNMELPPRRPKGSPENMQRSQAVAVRLRAKKIGK